MKPAVVSAEEEQQQHEEEGSQKKDKEEDASVPDKAIHEKLFLQIFTDDKRMFHLPYTTAVRSKRLAEIIQQEREKMNAQREAALTDFDARADPAARSLTVLLQPSLKLDGRHISEDAYVALCTYFELDPAAAETDVRLVAFDDFDQLADRIVAFEYMGIAPMTLRLSKLFHRLLMDAHSPAEARAALRINDASDYVSDNAFYTSAFGGDAAEVAQGAAGQPAKAAAEEEAEAEESVAHSTSTSTTSSSGVPRRILVRRERVRAFPDPDVCVHCRVPLGLPLRPKYVCRACGGAFCGDHCARTLVLPFAPVGETPRASLLGRVRSAVSGRAPVCSECYRVLSGTREEPDRYFGAMRAAALPLVSARRAGALSLALAVAAGQYLALLRALQGRLPCQSFSDAERRMLLANKRTFAGHARWTLQLLRALDYADPRRVDVARALLHPERLAGGVSPCADALCADPACARAGLAVADCAAALNGATFVLPPALRADLVARLARDAADADLVLHLPQLVHNVRYDACPLTRRHSSPESAAAHGCPLSAFLLERALAAPRDSSLPQELYWRCCCEGLDSLREILLTELDRIDREEYNTRRSEHGTSGEDGTRSEHGEEGKEEDDDELPFTTRAEQLIEIQALSRALQNRDSGSVLPRLQPLLASRTVRVPFAPARTMRYIDSVSNTASARAPFFVRYNAAHALPAGAAAAPTLEMQRTMETLAFYSQDVQYALVLRRCLLLCRHAFARAPDADLATLRIEAPPVVATARGCGFAHVVAPAVALRACVSREQLLDRLAALSPRTPAELRAQLQRSAAFYAALSYLTGLVFDDLLATPAGVLVPADLDMLVLARYTPYSMLHHFFYPFAADPDFVALSTKYYLALRALASHIYLAFRVCFDDPALAPAQADFRQTFTSHISRYSHFDIPPLRAQRLYAEALESICRQPESQFAALRKRTNEGLSSIWATLSAAPARVFGADPSPASDIQDEPADAGSVPKAPTEIEGEAAVANDSSSQSAESGAFKLK